MAQYGVVAEASKNIWNFDPTTIGGCTLWLDGADSNTFFSNTAGTIPATLNGRVNFWKDKSISGNNAITNTNTLFPILGPVFSSDGINNYLAFGYAYVQYTGTNSTTNTVTVISNFPLSVGQTFMFNVSYLGNTANLSTTSTYYIISSTNVGTTYTLQLSTTLGGPAFTITSTVTGQNIPVIINGSCLAFSNTSLLPLGQSNATYFFVFKNNNTAVTNGNIGSTILSYGNYSGSGARVFNTSPVGYGVSNINDPVPNNTANTVATTLYTTIYNNYTLTSYINGTSGSGGIYDIQQSTPGWNTGSSRGFIGSYIGENPYLTTSFSNIYEILVFNTSLSNTDRQTIEGYLAAKWGLQTSLPLSHPYYSPSLTNFRPTSLPGCSLWLDAADSSTLFQDTAGTQPITTTNSIVRRVNDKSGNVRNITTSNSTNTYTVSQLNGNSSVRVPSDSGFRTPSFAVSSTDSVSVFVVIQQSSTYTANAAFIRNETGGSTVLRMQAEASFMRNSTSGVSNSLSSMLTNLGNPNIYGMTFNSTTQICYLNGSSTGTVTGTSANTLNTADVYGIFTNTGPNGHLYEVLLYNSALTTTQRQQVEGYLATKWGLQSSLPPTHPYFSIASFVPTSIPGCSLWLDAADSSSVVRSGSNVTQWNDKSGNGRNMSTQGNSSFLTLVPNSISNNQSLYFDNSSGENVSLVGSFNQPANFSMFVVWRNLTQRSGSYRNILGWNFVSTPFPGAIMFGYPGSQTGSNVAIWDTNTGGFGTSINVSNNTNYIGYSQFPSPSLSLNGNTPSSTSVTTTSNAPNFIIGGILSNNQTISGYIGEVIVFNNVLSTTQRQQVEGYLAAKWGLQGNLPSSHPYSLYLPSLTYNQITTRPFSRSFTPTDIEGCHIWLDAADSTNVGLNATAWPDKSPSNISVSQGTANDQPTYYPSKQAVYFGGNATNRTRFTLGNVTPFLNTDLTIFIVERRESATGAIFGGSSGSVGQVLLVKYETSTSFQFNTFDSGPAFTVPAFTSATQEPYRIWCLTVAASRRQIFLNGTAGNAGTGTSPRLTSWATATIGTFNGLGQPLYNGTIKEIIFYNSQLSTANQQLIEGYLAWRWGLQGNLPSTHPHYNSGPATSPTSISGCILWLDGANVTTGTTVKALADKSGQENDCTNVTSTLTYTDTLNRLNVVTGISSGTSNLLQSPTITRDGLNKSYFAVIRYPTTGTSALRVINFITPSGILEFFGHSGNTEPYIENNYLAPFGGTVFFFYSGAPYASGNAFYGGNTFVLGCVRQNGVYAMSSNGSTVSPNTNTGQNSLARILPDATSGIYQISFGNSQTQVAEIIIYNTALNAYQRQIVEGYLCWKWGLRTGGATSAPNYSMPTNHPFFRFPPPALAPIQPELQLYKKQFDPSDLSPVIWIDPQDTSSMITDATTNRVRLIYNKGNAGLYTSASITSSSGTVMTLSSANAYLSVGQPVIFLNAPTGLTAGITYFVFSYNSSTRALEVTTTVGGATPVGGLSGSGFMVILPAFTLPLNGTGSGISGPLVTSSGIGSGNATRFLDFSNGGYYQVTSATVGADLTTLTLTVSPAHNGSIPVGAFINFTPTSGNYSGTGSVSATTSVGPFQILSATVSGGTTLTITTLSSHGIGNSQSVFLTINTGTFLGGASASSLTGTYTTAASGNTGTTIVLTIPSSTNGLMAISDGHVRNNVGTVGPYLTQAGTTGSTVVLTSYSPRASAGAISNFAGYIEYGSIPITSATLTSTTSLTVRTPINHGLTSGVSIGLGFGTNFILPFQTSINTSGTTINPAGIQFTNAVVSGGTTLTITVTSNPFYLRLSGVDTYTGITTDMRITLLAGTQFSDGSSATGLTATNYRIQANSNATTIVFTIPTSPNGPLNFTGLPGMIDSSTGNSNALDLNSTQTTSAGTTGNTIISSIPTFTSAIIGNLLRVRNTLPFTFPSDDSNVTFTSIYYPVNGYALENISLGDTTSGALRTSQCTIIWVGHYARAPYRAIRGDIFPMAIATATSANGSGGFLSTDYAVNSGTFAGAPRHAVRSNNSSPDSIIVSVNSDSSFRIYTAVLNLTSSAAADVPAYSLGTASLGWRNDNNFYNRTNNILAGSYSPATLTPVHFRIGGNTIATSNYTTHPLTTFWYEGGLGDVLIFNSILSVEQRQLVEGYLAQKYACQAFLGGTTVTPNTTSTYNITSGSVSGASAPFIITLGGTFSPAFTNSTQITISGASPSGLNGTWTLRSSNTSQVTFLSQTSLTWTSGGSITGVTTSNASFIHPYRLNPNSITSALTLTNTYSQGLVTWFDAANRSTLSFVSGNFISSWASVGGTLAITVVAPAATTTFWNPTYVLDSVGRPNVKFTRLRYTITTQSVDASNGILITSASIVPLPDQGISFNGVIAPNISGFSGYYIRTVTPVSGNDYIVTVSTTIGGTPLTLTQNSSLVLAGVIVLANTLAQTTGTVPMTSLTTQNINNDFTSVAVFSRDGTGGTYMLLYVGSGNTRISMEDSTRVCDYNFQGGSVTQPITYIPSTSPLRLNIPYILSYYRRGSTSFTRLIGNGGILSSTRTNTNNLNLQASGVSLRMGSFGSPDSSNYNNQFSGSIYEHMLFRYALTDQAIYQVEGYLAWKWGLQNSLPTTHPYYRVRP